MPVRVPAGLQACISLHVCSSIVADFGVFYDADCYLVLNTIFPINEQNIHGMTVVLASAMLLVS